MGGRIVRWMAMAGLIATAAGCGERLPLPLAPLRWRDEGILYLSLNESRGSLNIYRMNPDGSQPRNLTETEAFEFDPAWSPDRRQIAFAALDDLEAAQSDLFVMRADGSGRRRLTHFSSGTRAGEPTWSPDGRQIVFTVTGAAPDGRRQPEPRPVLFRIDTDGRHLTRLREGEAPSWSPDGRTILYTDSGGSDRGNPIGAHLKLIDPDGRNPRRLTRTEASGGVWSPDGRQIAFLGLGGRYPGSRHVYTDLFVMDADGSHVRQLTLSSASESRPQWSSDGRQILFCSLSVYGYGIPREIVSIRTDGTHRKSLTTAALFCWIGSLSGVPYLFPPVLPRGAPRRTTASDFNALAAAVASGRLDPLRRLLDRGANPNATADSDRSALMEAAQFGSPAMVRLLLDRGASSAARARGGRTALWWAINGHRPENVAALLEKGAGSETRDDEGRTPLMLACDLNDAALVRLLLDHGALRNARDRQGDTALHHAVQSGHAPMVQALLERQVDPNVRGMSGQTALVRAIVLESVRPVGRSRIVKMLLAQGANPSVKDAAGGTPLMYAIRTRQAETVRLLRSATKRPRRFPLPPPLLSG
jgi:Tol biopolymer transport system component/ankyrin repeat protein